MGHRERRRQRQQQSGGGNGNAIDMWALYQAANSDVVDAIAQGRFADAQAHFQKIGAAEVWRGKRVIAQGLPFYSERLYVESNPDVASQVRSGVFSVGFQHYISFGAREMLSRARPVCGVYQQTVDQELLEAVKPWFDWQLFLAENSELKQVHKLYTPEQTWEYFVKTGAQEVLQGRRIMYPGCTQFDAIEYVNTYGEVADKLFGGEIQSPFYHFLSYGAAEISQGNWGIRTADGTVSRWDSYLKANPDVVQLIANGSYRNALEHFQRQGKFEVEQGTRVAAMGLPFYNEQIYLQRFPEIAAAVAQGNFESPFEHYLQIGIVEMIAGQRPLCGQFPTTVSESIMRLIASQFDPLQYCQVGELPGPSSSPARCWEHFCQQGLQEILAGKREMYPDAGLFDPIIYANAFADVRQALVGGAFSSPFEHFACFGAKELAQGGRVYPMDTYAPRYVYVAPEFDQAVAQQLARFGNKPLISIVMPVYNVAASWLTLAVNSVLNQWYPNWELCLFDDASSDEETINCLADLEVRDPRIHLRRADTNGNISRASNQALAMAKGEFIALMDHDDELTVDALFEVVKVLQDSAVDFIYSDEDKQELYGDYCEPHFKPDFSPDMLLSHNYISHLTVIRKSLVEAVGGWHVGVEGAQDYDLYLRVLERTSAVAHIPKVLYHWRKVAGSTAARFGEKSYAHEAGKLALSNAMGRRGIAASVVDGAAAGTYRVRYDLIAEPLVSIIIPFKDKPDLLAQCLDAILASQAYQNFEIICMDNQSTDEAMAPLIKAYTERDSRVKCYAFNEPFNYSRINNEAVKHYCRGDYLVFMNNDIQVIADDWLPGLLEHAQRVEVGAVGAKLLYANSEIQHAGIVLAPDTRHSAINVFRKQHKDSFGYAVRLQTVNNYSAVTAALLMVSKTNFIAAGGFDETRLKIAYNDLDLCLSLLDLGKVNVYTPYVTAYHFESASRGYDEDIASQSKRGRELAALKAKHPQKFRQPDPYYSPNLSQDSETFMIGRQHTKDHALVALQPFVEEILYSKNLRDYQHDKLCIFSHYDRDGQIADYVVHYVQALARKCDVVFVSTAETLQPETLGKIEPYISRAVIKRNIGYDFGAWKTGIDAVGERLCQIDKLLLCNDSVYGPFRGFDQFFASMEQSRADVFGVTDSYEIRYHLQSYFVCFDKSVLASQAWHEFWQSLPIIADKATLIVRNELGLSQTLLDAGFTLQALAASEHVGYVNNMHSNWRACIEQCQCPFIKIELLRDNPLGVDIDGYQKVIAAAGDYPLQYIDDHLARFSDQ